MTLRRKISVLLSVTFVLALLFSPFAYARVEDGGGEDPEDCPVTTEVSGNTIITYNVKLRIFANGCMKKCGHACRFTMAD